MTSGNDQVREAILQQAADWFVANQAGPLGKDEREAFVAWLRTSPVHVEEYLGLAEVASSLEGATADSAIDIERLIAAARDDDAGNVVALQGSANAGSPVARARWYRPRPALVASVIVAVVAVSILATGWVHRADWLGVATPYASDHGERASFELPDGSTVQLNAESSITVRYDFWERRVELVRGQALFIVARGSQRPFRVDAGETSVVAVGTRFDVSKRPDAAIVTVVEGKVVVSSAPTRSATAADRADRREVAVSAGQRVRVANSGTPESPTVADLNSAEAWLRGQIAFQNRPLGEVADEFNAYAPVRFEIRDRGLGEELVTGSFNVDDFESFALFLASLDRVVIDRTPGRIIVTRRGVTSP